MCYTQSLVESNGQKVKKSSIVGDTTLSGPTNNTYNDTHSGPEEVPLLLVVVHPILEYKI